MGISIGEEARAAVVLPTACRLCGHRDIARLEVEGKSSYELTKVNILSPQLREEAREEAHQEAKINARYLGLFRVKICACPKCGRRDPRWFAWLLFVASGWGLVAAAIPFAIGAVAHAWPWYLGGLVWAAIPYALGTWWKTRNELSWSDAQIWFDSVHRGFQPSADA